MSVTARPGAPARQAQTTPLPLVVSGALAGASAGLLSYLALAVVALGAWMLDPSGSQEWTQMLEAASGAWLAGLGLAPTVDGVTISLLPIGFAILPLLGLVAAGRWATEASAVARRGEAVTVAFAAAAAFAVTGAVIAALSQALAVPLTRAGLVCAAVAFTVTLLAIMQRAGLLSMRALPVLARDAIAAACGALAVLTALSAALLALAVIVNVDGVTSLLVELDPGLSGAILLAVLTLGYLPNAIVWTMAYVIGPGVTIAVGTEVSAYADPATAALPGFPLLAALPADTPPGAMALPVMVVGAGALAGLLLRRRTQVGLHGAMAGALAGAVVGVAIGLLGWLTSGSLGTTSLQGLGPAPLTIGLVGGVLVGLGAMLVSAWPGEHADG